MKSAITMFGLEFSVGLLILAGCVGGEGGSGKVDLGEQFTLKRLVLVRKG